MYVCLPRLLLPFNISCIAVTCCVCRHGVQQVYPSIPFQNTPKIYQNSLNLRKTCSETASNYQKQPLILKSYTTHKVWSKLSWYFWEKKKVPKTGAIENIYTLFIRAKDFKDPHIWVQNTVFVWVKSHFRWFTTEFPKRKCRKRGMGRYIKSLSWFRMSIVVIWNTQQVYKNDIVVF